MRRSLVEILLAVLVLVAAVGFVVQLLVVDRGPRLGGYVVSAEFDDVGALSVGDRVTIAGLPAGVVTAVALDPETLFAIVDMSIDTRYRLPVDTRAAIGGGGLLGGASVVLTPGAAPAVLPARGVIPETTGSVNTVDALGRRIFSAGDG